jgi:predicted alpha/beta superfamily hydrolase
MDRVYALLGAVCLALTGCAPATEASGAAWPIASAAPVATTTALPTATAPEPPTATPPAPTAVPVCTETAGQVAEIGIPLGASPYAIDTRVYLPACYDFGDRRYPVLYLLHGLGFEEDQWDRLGAPAAADQLIAEGTIAPLILVMPRDQGDQYERFFLADIVPYIDATYRTIDHRLARAIGGLSRGGGWAMHIGLQHPELFSRIGGHSPAVFYSDDASIVSWLRAIPANQPVEVYLDVGQGDSLVDSAFYLDQVFTAMRVTHTFNYRPGGHTETYWSRFTPEYLTFYAGAWRTLSLPGDEAPVDNGVR